MLLLTFTVLVAAVAVHGQSCGGNVAVEESKAVVISSPNHPGKYPQGASCSWTLTAPAGKAIKFTATSFNLEGSGTSCSYDYVEIDGVRYCGALSNFPNALVVASPAVVRFVSDSSVEYSGFQISAIASAPLSNECGGDVIVEEGKVTSFVSPRWPANYNDNANCIWLVKGLAGKGLQFNSAFFNVEGSGCGYDFLSFTETVDGVAKLLGTFCDASGPSKLRSSTSEVTVRFKSDSSINRPGFNITVKEDNCPGQSTCRNNETVCISLSQYCDGVENDCPDNIDEQYCNAECGISPIPADLSLTKVIDPRIVGGAEAVPHSWPWQVAYLTNSGFQSCGATLISANWVLSAAHCCGARPNAASIKLRIGAHNLNNPNSEPSSKIHAVKRAISHPNYGSSPATKWDFCLLELEEPAQLGQNVVPACLASPGDEIVGTRCFVTGWGNTSPRSSLSEFDRFMRLIDQAEAGKLPKDVANSLRATTNLYQVDVNLVDQSECNTAYGGVIQPNMICAAAPGKDTCQGDSGGPLVCPKANGDAGFVLVGVTSWGRGCASPGYPGVYGKVSVAADWIAETMLSK